MTTPPSNNEVWDLFHTMWDDAKAQRSYTKANWMALQGMLRARLGDREKPVQMPRSDKQVFFGPAESIGPRPDSAIQALTAVVVAAQLQQPRPVQSEDVQRLLDYMTFLEMKAALVDQMMVSVVRLPDLIARAVQAAGAEPLPQPNKWTYNVEGHVCGETGRKAMTVAQVLELMKDDPDSVRSHTYDPEAAGMGLDPWRLVDGIDPSTREPNAELWFDSGGTRTVELTSILYVQQPKAKK